MYVEILESKAELVSVWGWSDPEHAYTNVTSNAGGVVFCTFSTPNLSFWIAFSVLWLKAFSRAKARLRPS